MIRCHGTKAQLLRPFLRGRKINFLVLFGVLYPSTYFGIALEISSEPLERVLGFFEVLCVVSFLRAITPAFKPMKINNIHKNCIKHKKK